MNTPPYSRIFTRLLKSQMQTTVSPISTIAPI